MAADADHIQRVMKANLSFARAAGHVGAAAFEIAAKATKEMTGFAISDFIPVAPDRPSGPEQDRATVKDRALALLARGPATTSTLANRIKISPENAEKMMDALMADGLVKAGVGPRKYRGGPVTIWSMK